MEKTKAIEYWYCAHTQFPPAGLIGNIPTVRVNSDEPVDILVVSLGASRERAAAIAERIVKEHDNYPALVKALEELIDRLPLNPGDLVSAEIRAARSLLARVKGGA